MPLPPQEAADALQEIQRARQRSVSAYHDRMASPHLILWGIIWFLAYGATFAWPQAVWRSGQATFSIPWAVLLPAGILASMWIGSRHDARGRRPGRKYYKTLVAVFLFITALFAILPPRSGNQAAAFFPLLVAIWYVLEGIWHGTARMGLLGWALGALTVGGYFGLPHPQYFVLWMAALGGGALVLGGFWMRGV